MFTLGCVCRTDSVSIEHIVSILRYHAAGAYGSPVVFSATMMRFGDVAIMIDGRGNYTPVIRSAIRLALRSLGIKSVQFNRMYDGKKRLISVSIAP